MKQSKRILAVLAASLIAASAASCGNGSNNENASTGPVKGDGDPFGKYEETVVIRVGTVVDATIKFPQGETAEDNRYTRLVKDKLNIETEVMWQVGTSADYNQKMNLAIASNDLPDATIVNKVQLATMAKSKQLENMTDIIDEYASENMKAFFDTTNGDALKAASYDGQVVGMPNVQADADGYHMMWIRKDWLDELGLPVPTSVEDVQAAAKAFVENDMSGTGKTIGISGPQSGRTMHATFLESSNNDFGLDPIFSAYHSYPGYWLDGGDGNVAYGSIQPETKEALTKLSEMYAEGLIDPEMGIRADSKETVVSGQSGIFFAPWWMGYSPIPDALRNDPEASWQAFAAPLDSEGKWTPHVAATTGQFTVVRKGFEHPEAIIKLANLSIQEEPNMDTSELPFQMYPLQNTQGTTDEVQVTTGILQDYLAGKVTLEEVQDKTKIYVGLESDLNSVKDTKLEPYDNNDIQYWNTENENFGRIYSMLVGAKPLVDTEIEKVKSVTYVQTDMMLKKWSTLKKMEDEVFLKIVTGAAPVDDFDKFVTDWKKQGGDDILKELTELNMQ